LIFTLVRADGVVVIPPATTGLATNAEVEVRLI
jgi:molybdopterin biosynthesis enzyme